MADSPAPKPRTDEELLANAIPIEATEDGEALELEPAPDRDEDSGSARIRTFDPQHEPHENRWKRKPNRTGQGAIHVKTFYAKLRPDAIEHLDEQINHWLDSHEEYEVKFVTTSVGQLVGKHTEDAIVVNVWV